MIDVRLKEERERLGLSQPSFAETAGAAKRTLVDWEKGVSSPTAVQLSALSRIGVDVTYVLTGVRQGQGIGESAVHQAVIDAIDLLSLDRAVDANQLARAVVKLCARTVQAVGTLGAAAESRNSSGGLKQKNTKGISIGVVHGTVTRGDQTNHIEGDLIFGAPAAIKPKST